MGVNWGNVIQNQMNGMDAVSAFYKEEQRVRKQRAEEYKELCRRQQEQRERAEDENNAETEGE